MRDRRRAGAGLPILTAMLAVALLLVGCSGGHGPTAGSSRDPSHSQTGSRIELALQTGSSLAVDLPGQPRATVPTTSPGMSLEVWLVRAAVQVVFALHNTAATAESVRDVAGLGAGLDLNGLELVEYTDDVGLLDTSGLKDYETFVMSDSNGRYDSCLCTKYLGGALDAGARSYYAAVVAAPPSGATLTLVTGVGSVPGLTASS